MLFIVSAASISASLILFLAERSRLTMSGVRALHDMESWVVVLELIVLVALMFSLGPVLSAWLNAWGVLLLVVVLLGIVAPLALMWRKDLLGERNLVGSTVLVLLGGFLLRLVIVFSAQGV